jgi:hypothetical protein
VQLNPTKYEKNYISYITKWNLFQVCRAGLTFKY